MLFCNENRLYAADMIVCYNCNMKLKYSKNMHTADINIGK
jgi:hypothetical protein